MIVRVARAFGQDPMVVAEQPFATTAWSLLQLLEVERFDELARDAESLRTASRTGIAVNDPKLLKQEHEALQQRLRAPVGGQDLVTARARGLALLERLTRGQVLS